MKSSSCKPVSVPNPTTRIPAAGRWLITSALLFLLAIPHLQALQPAETKLTASDGAADDQFGYSVAMSADGNSVIVGAAADDVNSNADQGSAYVYQLPTAASAVDTDGNSSAGLTLAQGALTDGYIVVGVSMYDPVVDASITAVTYGGVPMTLLGTIQDANAYTEVYLFGLAVGNLAAGNYDVALTGSKGINQLAFGVSAFSGVNQTAPTGPFASATGSSTAPSVIVSSAFGDLVVDILGHDNGTSSVGADQAQNWKQEDATDRTDGVSSRETATGAATTMSHSKTVSAPWSIGALALKP